MVTDLPAVTLWEDQGTQWRQVGDLPVYDRLSLDVRFNDAGAWSVSAPWDVRAAKAGPGQMVTFDWRGLRVMTGIVERVERGRERADDDGWADSLTLSGLDALAYLGYSTAWPLPGQPIGSQVLWAEDADAPIVDSADRAVLKVVKNNLFGRRGLSVSVPTGTGMGSTVRIRPAFDNLLELALRKAGRGGIGLRATLSAADLSDAVAPLTVEAYLPSSRATRVVFSDEDGSVGEWSWIRSAPTCSRAIVSGVQGAYRVVDRSAPQWNPVREQFVQGPASFDAAELDQAGEEALDAGAPQTTVQVEAVETGTTLAFRDYLPGDTATARLGGRTLTAPVTAVGVTVDADGPVVRPVFGDPDGVDPQRVKDKLLRSARRDVDKQKRRT